MDRVMIGAQPTVAPAIQDNVCAVTQSLAASNIGSNGYQINLRSVSDDKNEKYSRWLSSPDTFTDHNRARRQRQPSTGLWFLEGSQFRGWRTFPDKILWLHGIPGSGKTVLCSAVIDEILLACSNSKKVLAYFYCDINDDEKRRLKNLVRSLVLQISMQNAQQSLALNELYNSSQCGQRQPPLYALTATLRRMLQESEESFIIIDAIDECEEIESLLGFLQELIDWKVGTLHLLVTSRSRWDIQCFFVSAAAISVSISNSSVDADIRVYIRERLLNDRGLKRWRSRPTVQMEIETTLMEGADGMFWWVVCQLDALRACLSISHLRKALASLPRTLDETYAQILCNINEDYVQDAWKVLQWLTYSTRPLRVEEAAEIVAIDLHTEPRFDPEKRLLEPRDVSTICSDLVTICSVNTITELGEAIETEELRFAHSSVREYLTSDRILGGPAAYYSIEKKANLMIAESCIAYLFSINASDLLSDDFNSDYPLYKYASHEWHYHVKRIPKQENVDHMDTIIEKLLDPAHGHLVNWLRMFDPDMPWKPSLNPHKTRRETCSALYYASSLGLSRTVMRLLQQGADVDIKGGSLGTPLQAATYHGHEMIVMALLEGGADCLNRCGHYGTALQAAKFARHDKVVELLEQYDTSDCSTPQLKSHIRLLATEKAPFEVLDLLGGGGSGMVEKVRNLTDGRICVRKTIKTPNLSQRTDFLQEVRIMQKLQHRHVVDVLGSYSRGKTSSILLLPVADQDLEDYINELDVTSCYQVGLLIKWLTCLGEGLRYIHSQNVKHKDIKPQNLLIRGANILYTDFGIAHDFEGEISVTAGQTGFTRRYSAPEVVGGDDRSRSADIFSLGCVYLEMLAANYQLNLGDFDDYATSLQEDRSQVSISLDELVLAIQQHATTNFTRLNLLPNLIRSMLAKEPYNRPKAGVLARELSGDITFEDGSYRCCPNM